MSNLRQTLDYIRNELLAGYFPQEYFPKDYFVGYKGYVGKEFSIENSGENIPQVSKNKTFSLCSYYHKNIDPKVEKIVSSYALKNLGLDISDEVINKPIEDIADHLGILGYNIYICKSINNEDIGKTIKDAITFEKRRLKSENNKLVHDR